MRCEPAEEFAARLSIVDAQEHVSAEVRRRPLPQDGRLDLVQVERRRVRRKIRGGGFLWRTTWRHPFMGPGPLRPEPKRTMSRCGYPTLSRNSSTALPTRFEPRRGLRHRQIRMGDVPAFCRDLVLDDPVLHLRAANPWPAFERREDDVHVIGNLRREVVDIGVPLAVVGGREEKLRVVVQEDEAHVVDGANLRPARKLPSSNRSTARSRLAPPGANGAITVNSETLP